MEIFKNPRVRRDLEFFPVQQGNERFVLIRDSLGLVEEGKALPIPLYEILALLDGTRSVRDLQIALMRQRGGVLVGTDEVERLLTHLDESFLLHTEKYLEARERIVAEFASKSLRPCSHCGRSYPAEPKQLKGVLEEVLGSRSASPEPEGKVIGLVAPHIDLSVGPRVYGNAYRWIRNRGPDRILVLGVGHQMTDAMFSLTLKDFQTPLGVARNDREAVQRLIRAAPSIISDNDFVHKAEHSLEFQIIFLQHVLNRNPITIIPVLCGSIMGSVPAYTREGYLEKAGPLLEAISETVCGGDCETLVVAGVDFSHIGPKFGHDMPAAYLETPSQAHDQALMKALSERDSKAFWGESQKVEDKFNVCGFSALACLLEILPPARGWVLDYQMWHEQPTQSAVSFAALAFTEA